MAYRKKRGILACVIVDFTPYWLDVIISKSGAEACIFLKYKMSEKMKESMEKNIEQTTRCHILVEKMHDEDMHYKFMGFSGGSHLGVMKKNERIMAYEALQREVNVDYGPVRSRSNRQKLVTGRAGLTSYERTGNKITNALSSRVDNSKTLVEVKCKAKAVKINKERIKALTKLRRKYFYDRELQPSLTDKQWDSYLLETYGGNAPTLPPVTDNEFEDKLREAGLL